MSELKKAFLGGIAYETGEPRDIEEIPELKADEEVLENLLALGCEKYAVYNGSPMEMAKRCVARTLEKTGVNPQDVGAVVYATTAYAASSKPWKPLRYGDEIAALILELGLTRAHPLWVSLAQCTNLTAALRVAGDMVRCNEAQNVIVILADCVGEGYSRLVAPNITIMSDAAVTCLVTSDPKSEYEILGVQQYADWEMSRTDPYKSFTKYFKGTANGVKNVSNAIYQQLGLKASDFKALMMNNASLSVTRVFSEQTGVPVTKIFTENIPKFAHCDAADNLINLHDYALKGTTEPGDLFLLLASAPYIWGASVVRKT